MECSDDWLMNGQQRPNSRSNRSNSDQTISTNRRNSSPRGPPEGGWNCQETAWASTLSETSSRATSSRATVVTIAARGSRSRPPFALPANAVAMRWAKAAAPMSEANTAYRSLNPPPDCIRRRYKVCPIESTSANTSKAPPATSATFK